MTIKVDGTNGVLQAYDYQVLTTGFSYTFAAGTQTLIANPAGTLATGTITMPASPADGMVINIESTQQITALTVQGNTGQSLVNGTITLAPNVPLSFIYRLTNTTWYPFAGAANNQLFLGTAQNSTSGTSIDFTSIPSWVKRITVMFNGVSTSGTAYVRVQLGTSSGPETSGYLGSCTFSGAGTSTINFTSGFDIYDSSPSAANVLHGAIVISTISSNTFVCFGSIGQSDSAHWSGLGGSKALSGTLDRVRITTSNGTDTFDAGSINILYE